MGDDGQPGGVADQLIAQLPAEGEAVDAGRFSLDPAKARDKLRQQAQLEPRQAFTRPYFANTELTASGERSLGAGPILALVGVAAVLFFISPFFLVLLIPLGVFLVGRRHSGQV
ncbi:hypothetical protein G6O69_11510 [Pseudenhygromyxa sp. WMMC2535]|uniref:hypothetical protein n=1 Tax=Pseudenhygromyxa sp. WMMC2535 TaxID=2712867 RepID=UPI0015561D65|nr:hypothetical protein [Pseudenhygromyxa sp. WMMC2535]NVB38460.1 hypothetical protein [Pseudenhygromyxa sp. WMMC2535]